MYDYQAMTSNLTHIVDRSYLLHQTLGAGGMGTVYRATRLGTDQQVALKLVRLGENNQGLEETAVSTKLRLALAREFQTLASLHHPNVIRVLSYGFDDVLGSYFTMELLDSPQSIVEAAAERSLEDKIVLIAQLLRALIYVHQRGILHRDIKPSEVAGCRSRRRRGYAEGLRTSCGRVCVGLLGLIHLSVMLSRSWYQKPNAAFIAWSSEDANLIRRTR